MESEKNLKCMELLSLVIDGQATLAQEKELMQHVAKCVECRNEFELSSSIKDNLKNRLQKVNSPRDLSSSITAKISGMAS